MVMPFAPLNEADPSNFLAEDPSDFSPESIPGIPPDVLAALPPQIQDAIRGISRLPGPESVDPEDLEIPKLDVPDTELSPEELKNLKFRALGEFFQVLSQVADPKRTGPIRFGGVGQARQRADALLEKRTEDARRIGNQQNIIEATIHNEARRSAAKEKGALQARTIKVITEALIKSATASAKSEAEAKKAEKDIRISSAVAIAQGRAKVSKKELTNNDIREIAKEAGLDPSDELVLTQILAGSASGAAAAPQPRVGEKLDRPIFDAVILLAKSRAKILGRELTPEELEKLATDNGLNFGDPKIRAPIKAASSEGAAIGTGRRDDKPTVTEIKAIGASRTRIEQIGEALEILDGLEKGIAAAGPGDPLRDVTLKEAVRNGILRGAFGGAQSALNDLVVFNPKTLAKLLEIEKDTLGLLEENDGAVTPEVDANIQDRIIKGFREFLEDNPNSTEEEQEAWIRAATAPLEEAEEDEAGP